MSEDAAEIARLRAELAATRAELAQARAVVSASEAMISHLKLELAKLRREPARLRAVTIPPRVVLDNHASNTHTVIEVNGRDRPGLLHAVTAFGIGGLLGGLAITWWQRRGSVEAEPIPQ